MSIRFCLFHQFPSPSTGTQLREPFSEENFVRALATDFIPKPLREELHVEPSDALEVESAGARITLRPDEMLRHIS